MADRTDRPKPRGRTGPRSLAGKATSSRNATTHGCTSARLILPNESAEEWEALRQQWLDDIQPDSDTFSDLVMRAAEADWLLRRNMARYHEVEHKLYQEQSNPLLWTEEQHKLLERFLRYRTAAERVFYRARGAAEQARKTRFSEEKQTERFELAKAKFELQKERKQAAEDEEEDDEDEAETEAPPKPGEILQYAMVTVEDDGKTTTTLTRSNEHVLKIAEKFRKEGREPITIVRQLGFFFCEIPPEYEWVKAEMERANAQFDDLHPLEFNPISVEQFLKDIERERLDGSGHWLPA